MKVLHISDLHFESLEKNEYSLQKIVDKIVVQCKDEKLDYIFFTGDLVFKGDDLNDFYAAQLLVLEELSQKLSVKKENVIFCCGNHDVHRGQELPLITEHLNKMTSEKDLEDFITSEARKMEYENSLLNIENFLKFQKDYFKDDFDRNNINDLYSIHSRETSDGKKIAIVSINTSWRCYDSDKDFGNLLFPNKLIENISLAIKNYDFKILLLHHPLAELRYWNKALIENKIYENFHVMLLGHIHKDVKSSIANNDEGLISSSSTAVLSNISEYEKMGFSLLDIDIELKNVAFKNYNIDSDNIVYKTNEYTLDIPVSGVKKEYIELRKKITRLYDIELENGNDLFLNNIHGKKGFFEKFSNPVLKNKSITEISDLKNSTANNVEITNLLKDLEVNRVIYGKDKYGKTIILYYLYLNLLSKFSEVKVIPIYLNSTKTNNYKNFTVEKFIRKIYELTSDNNDFLYKNYKIIFLIDDFAKITDLVKKEIEKFIEMNPSAKVVVTEDENLLSHSDIILDSLEFEKVFIHELSSKEVKDLTKSSLNCSEDTTTNLLGKIKLLFTQLNLNFNFWTVSLFIWIFNKSESSIFRNNFELMQLYIDNLLDRETIVAEKSLKIEYQQLKDFLSDLSYFLVTNKYDTIYHLSYTELVEFVKNYKSKNSRFYITTEDLLNLIIDRGILKHNKDNEMYTFRLKGVFEYFIALYMSENSDFTDEVIENKEFYLSFGNELELYAGFKQKDEGFIEKIFNRTKEYYSELNAQYEGTVTDYNLESKIKEINLLETSIIKKGIKNEIERGDRETVDELGDRKAMNQNVSLKKYQEVIKNSEQLEKALFIMCRVFRNSTFKNQKLENEILDFVLQSACNLSFLIIDEKNNDNKDDVTIQIFKNFTPMVVQNFLFEAVAQENLQQVFEKKIEELRKSGNEELKLFALYFILIDLDFNSNKKYIAEITKLAKKNIIKYGILFKLFTYLIFNKTNDKEFLRKAILDQQRKIDGSSNAIDNIQKTFSHFEKISTTKKLKED